MHISQVSTVNNTPFKTKKNSNPKVSVIIPIYNQEKFLAKALDSLINQTLKETEFLCVNDGSKDGSLKILEEYRNKDNRIKIINQKNQGAGPARNQGLKFATGDYIAFLDPDDYLEKDALKTLYKQAKQQKCDLLVFDFKRCNEDGKTVGEYHIKDFLKSIFEIKENENFNWRDIKAGVFGKLFPASWNKFYKKDLIKENKLYFSKTSLAEDMNFVFGATLKAKNIGYLNKSLYNYTVHEKSATRVVSDKNLCIFKAIDSVRRMLEKNGLYNDLAKEFDDFVVWLMIFHTKLVKSPQKLLNRCENILSLNQNKILKEELKKNYQILSILEGLKKKL